MKASLSAYNRMRRFGVTAEPEGRLPRKRSGRSFVVQKHDATRLHYDFRLELDGVLKSWAVPKGPSLSPGDKRLAMQTEDHPVSYRDFEGVIPQGEYGAGPVIVWDRGAWQPLEDPHKGLRKGSLAFELDGEKLKGRFSLVRLRSDEEKSGKPWLLMKRTDEYAKGGKGAEITERLPQSVISGRTVEEVEQGVKKKSRSSPRKPVPSGVEGRGSSSSKVPDARVRGHDGEGNASLLEYLRPQLATLVERPPAGDDYIYEIKYDGYRALAVLNPGEARLLTRTGLDWTERFPNIADALARLGRRETVFDGEICYVLEDGRSDFQKLQNALRNDSGSDAQSRLIYFVFDLLFFNGEDLRELPLVERKKRLKKALPARKGVLRIGEHLEGEGRVILAQACQLGLEGLIGKRRDRPYRPGRSGEWIKLKCHKRQEFVIVGMTAPKKSRQGFGSLLLGLQDEKGLRYAGKVGTGFTDPSLRELTARLKPLVADRPPVRNAPRFSDATWVQPKLVCEVSFTEVTQDGVLRHPSFEGLREDKPAAQVALETPETPRPAAKPKSKTAGAIEVAGVRITHPERVMDAQSGTRKLDLARYHEAVSDWLMPYAERRVLALVRCPEGDAAQCFFQKQAAAGFGKSIVRRRIAGRQTLHVTEPRDILELVQFNVVELHGWGSRLPAWDKPDWFVLDLDPGPGISFPRVVEAALEVKELLDSLKLVSFVKTTGGKGLHVVAPLRPRLGWEAVKSFTQSLAQELARRSPSDYIATLSKQKREGKIFVDYLRNGPQATAVLPYSPRVRPGATVAMPVDWKDLKHLDPREFTVATVPGLLRRRKRDPWAGFEAARQDLSEKLGAGPRS